MRLYEGMFLVDHNTARTNFEEIEGKIHAVISRFEGEIVQSLKWAERKLAYPIRYNNKVYKKGTYILVHFNSGPQEIRKMDRQFRLSDWLVRHFIIRDEDGLIDIEKFDSSVLEKDDLRGFGREGRGRRDDRRGGGRDRDGGRDRGRRNDYRSDSRSDSKPESKPESKPAEPKPEPKPEAKAAPAVEAPKNVTPPEGATPDSPS